MIDYLTDRVLFFIERFGKHNIDIAENSKLAIQYLESKVYDIIFIGGELGGGGHGSDAAEWLAKNNENPNFNSTIYTHTWNSIEVELILRTLPQARYVPFDEMIYSTFDI